MNRFIAPLLALVAFASPGFGQDGKVAEQRKPRITIGKDTTYVDGPLGQDGRIDYVAAANELLGKGVTPDNNANVLLIQAIGPRVEGAELSPKYFELLKAPAPKENGSYFVASGRFAQREKVDVGAFTEDVYDAGQRAWTAKDKPEVARWLKANETPLELVVASTRRTHYYNPLVADTREGKPGMLIGVLLPTVQSTREFAHALAVRAMLRAGEKDYAAAWQDLLACHRLGRSVGEGGTLMEGLVGIAIDHIACQADVGLLDAAKFDAKKLKQCLADLDALPPMPSFADKPVERLMFLDAVMALERDGFRGLGLLESMMGKRNDPLASAADKFLFSGVAWDTTLRAGNAMYDRLFAAIDLKDRRERQKALVAIDAEVRNLRGEIGAVNSARRFLLAKNVPEAKGKYVGDVLVYMLFPGIKLHQSFDYNEQVHLNLRVAFALAAYKADQGSYPKSLDALAPRYLAKAPVDLLTDKDLIYRPAANGFIVYSVGVNGQDEGGRGIDDHPRGDDVAVRLPAPEARQKELE